MRIAVAAMGNEVAGHFGHCETFIFFDTEDDKIVELTYVPNPGHRPGFLPNFLADNDVKVIISGGMGGGVSGFPDDHVGGAAARKRPARTSPAFADHSPPAGCGC